MPPVDSTFDLEDSYNMHNSVRRGSHKQSQMEQTPQLSLQLIPQPV